MVKNKQIVVVVKRLCILSLLFVFVLFSSAQDSTIAKKKWQFSTEVYMMFANLNGTVGLGTLPDAKVDADFGDILENLKMAAMLYLEVSSDKWAISSDLVYMKLEQDATPGTAINSGKVTVKQLAWELAGLRKLSPTFDAGIGLRLNNLDNQADLVTNNIGGSTTARSKSLTKTWVDPVIIARLQSDPAKKFIYQFRGDMGGFGVGSDFAWQIQVYAGYRFSKLFQLTGGYRVLSVDYNKGSSDNRFLYDMSTFGPVLRFGFNF
jgi:hypothetical protein